MAENILFIVADDLNAWISALGRHPDVRTPHIDRLAASGTLFTRAYCAAPYCNASRMSVFTGRYPHSTGIYCDEPLWDRPGRPLTFVERLRQSGYYTFGAGKVFHGVFDYSSAGKTRSTQAKWREIENRSHLWNEFISNSFDPLPSRRLLNGLLDASQLETAPNSYQLFDWGPIPDDRAHQLPDENVVRSIQRFLSTPRRQPFFCAAGLYKPHLPWHVPQKFFSLYDTERISLPLVKNDDLDDVPPIARAWALSPADHELVTSRGEWRNAVRGYLAAVSYCDDAVGRLVSVVDTSPYADSTWIIVWGDNGFHLGEKLHWRKFALWEEACRVPLIIVPPKRTGSSTPHVHDPVSLIDIFPSILDIAGLPSEAGVEGLSLLGAMRGESMHNDRAVLMTWGRDNHSIRSGEWRFTRYADKTMELYNHRADPYEWTNLANDARYRDTMLVLGRLLSMETRPVH